MGLDGGDLRGQTSRSRAVLNGHFLSNFKKLLFLCLLFENIALSVQEIK